MSGRLRLYIGISLDGRIADADGGVAWLEAFLSPQEDYGYGEFMGEVGAVLMGATTYLQELERGSWPYGERPAWVATHRGLARPPEADVRFTADPLAELPGVREAAGERDVFVVGGAQLAQLLLAAGELDELRLFVAPVLLGEGPRLFADVPGPEVRLRAVRSFASGIAELVYEPD